MNLTTLELDTIYIYFIKLGHFIPTGIFPGENLTFLQTMIVISIILQIDLYFRFYILAEEAGAEVEEGEEAKEAEE